MNRLRYLLAVVAMVMYGSVFCQNFDKASFYSSANGKKGQALKTALAGIIYRSSAAVSYDGLLDAYKKTDVRSDGRIWDMYSNVTNYDPSRGYASTYKNEGDGYNREHSIPQSVFNSGSPMKSDLYHVYPTDSKINGMRSNYCFGEVDGIKTASRNNFSKLGTPTQEMKSRGCREGYVFEPNDMYKGDFARTYFYFVTCYESKVKSFDTYGMFTKDTYPSLSSWASDLLMKWSEADAVSEKETDRIEAVYALQYNRNPFIDFPGLEQYIWGDYQNVAFNASEYVNPYADSGTSDDDDDDDDSGSGNTGVDDVTAQSMAYRFINKSWKAVLDDGTSADWLCKKEGLEFYEAKGVQVTKGYSGAGATSPCIFKNVCNVVVKYATNTSSGAGSIDIKVGTETFKSDKNITTEGGVSLREITYTPTSVSAIDGDVTLTVNCSTNSIYVYSVTVNCAASEEDGIEDFAILRPSHPTVYDLYGRRVAPDNLKRGIYIVNGRKVLIDNFRYR